MTNFSHIIFDLDGTLTNPKQGIGNSLKYALRKLEIDSYSEQLLEQFIGPPLQWGFQNLFGLNERNTKLAVEYFRKYFEDKGWHENEPYPGVYELLEELHFAGKQIYIATSKLEKYALKISRHFEFDKYIVQLKGADYGGKSATKSTIISDLLESCQVQPSTTIVMIGDTHFDIVGGKENGIATIAVSYGFGKVEDLQNADPDFMVDSIDELYDLLL